MCGSPMSPIPRTDWCWRPPSRLWGEDERQVVLLHAVSGLRHREIARDLGLPLSTVLSRVQSGTQKTQALSF